MIKTVLGKVCADELGVTLVHEHICCFSEYAYKMAGVAYLDKKALVEVAATYLKKLHRQYGLSTFVDCTPVNIGRDIDLLKRVSAQAQVNIIASTGFYYTDEPVLYQSSTDYLSRLIIADAKTTNAGVIKCAVEDALMSVFQKRLLQACAKAHLHTGLPIVVHTNARNRNALKALEVLLLEKVKPSAITVAHLSDTEDMGFVKSVASYGCYIGLDRLYGHTDDEYITKKVQSIKELWRSGYQDQILLSHDALFFNGFDPMPRIQREPRFSYCFEYILSQLPREVSNRLMKDNPARMLRCQ